MADTSEIIRYGCGITLFSGCIAGLTSAGSAVSAAVGASIMNESGHDGYDPTEAAQSGAIGGAIIGLPVSLVIGCCQAASILANGGDATNLVEAAQQYQVGKAILSVGFSVLSGVVGYSILAATGDTEMSMGAVAASAAVGSAVFAGCNLALSAVCPTPNQQ